MVKRKRLTPAQSDYLGTNSPALETKSMAFPAPRAPIAQVAGEASAAAALQELAGEVKRARDEGRMIQALATDQIEVSYLVRDRMLADDAELRSLMESLRARGQQTPIEVVALDQGRYGLISGWRRLTALHRLSRETGDDRFATVQAILRQPETAADAYISMVEENEIRVGLSYYERARVAAKAVEQGVFETEKQALLSLFSTASRARRSKIRSFLTLYREAEDQLKFASAIPERLGLALIRALEDAPARAADLRAALRDAAAGDAASELACLEALLARFGAEKTRAGRAEPAVKQREKSSNAMPGGIELGFGYRKATLSGPGVTEAFQKRLREWLKTQN